MGVGKRQGQIRALTRWVFSSFDEEIDTLEMKTFS
jgi:hypothetical protein